MSARKKLLSCLVFLTIAAALAWQLWRSRIPDPVYRGKPLSYWLDRDQGAPLSGEAPSSVPGQLTNAGQESAVAPAAVRQAGTNAIPLLLHYARAHDSPIRRKFCEMANSRFPKRFHFVSAEAQHFLAFYGFSLLGSDGSPAVPELIRIYDADVSYDSQNTVLSILECIGPKAQGAIPLLAGVITNSTPWRRVGAARALGQIHEQPETVIPLLISSLDHTDRWTAETTVEALANYGTNARTAVPKLLEIYRISETNNLSNSRAHFADTLINALIKIDPAAARTSGIQVASPGPVQWITGRSSQPRGADQASSPRLPH